MRFHSVVAAAILLNLCSLAHADTFTITGNGQNISFLLPHAPVPTQFATTTGFVVSKVSVNVNGSTFITDVGFGSTSVYDPGKLNLFIGNNEGVYTRNIILGYPSYGTFTGSKLYSGTEANPTFLLGSTFSIVNSHSTPPNGPPNGTYSLSITDGSPTAVTPEPSTLALLGTGMLCVAGVLRKRIA